MRFTHDAHRIERIARIPGEKRSATMVEHSWQLALLAWYIIDTEKLSLNKELVLKYAIAHDLVETYAGDTYIYDETAKATKEKREEEALTKIKTNISEFPGLATTIEKYEKKQDAESKFVYALDKLIDPLNIYLEGGLLWHEKGVTLDMLLSYKLKKVSSDKNVERIFLALVEKLKSEEADLFPSPSK